MRRLITTVWIMLYRQVAENDEVSFDRSFFEFEDYKGADFRGPFRRFLFFFCSSSPSFAFQRHNLSDGSVHLTTKQK